MQLKDAIAQDEFDALCKFADGLQSEVFYVLFFYDLMLDAQHDSRRVFNRIYFVK